MEASVDQSSASRRSVLLGMFGMFGLTILLGYPRPLGTPATRKTFLIPDLGTLDELVDFFYTGR